MHANQLLELIQKGLNDYLEAKRLSFARLFFLSNDELLQILSETKDPTKVQPHLKKCFEGINKLTFDDKLIIHAMDSVEGEKVPFNATLDPNAANGMVEKWLLEVEGMMKESVVQPDADDLRGLHEQAARRVGARLARHGHPRRRPDLLDARDRACARHGRQQGLKAYEAQCTKQLDDMVMLVRTPISKLQRYTLGAMVTLDVHGRDVLTFMVQAGVRGGQRLQLGLAAALLLRPQRRGRRHKGTRPLHQDHHLDGQVSAGSTSATPSASSSPASPIAATARSCRRSSSPSAAPPRGPPAPARRRPPRTWRRRSPSSAWCSTAPTASTTWRWPSSSRASPRAARGRASTSSTASTSRCSRWWRSRC